jgi:hypothetical protein
MVACAFFMMASFAAKMTGPCAGVKRSVTPGHAGLHQRQARRVAVRELTTSTAFDGRTPGRSSAPCGRNLREFRVLADLAGALR